MTTHTTDTFSTGGSANLESHTPDSGGPWSNIDGVVGTLVSSGTGFLNYTNGGAFGCWSVPIGSADMYAESTIPFPGSVGGASFLFSCVRATNKSNQFGLLLQSSSNIQFYKQAAGSFTLLVDITGLSIANNDRMRLTVTGNTFQVKQNGTNIGASATDSFNNTETKAGLVYLSGGPQNFFLSKFESDANGGVSTNFFPAVAMGRSQSLVI